MIRVRGVGPFYWGVEHESTHPDKRPVAAAFMVESNPPHRRSQHGMRFRLGNHELHFGICKKGGDPEKVIPTPHSDPEVAVILQAIYDTQAEDAERAMWDY